MGVVILLIGAGLIIWRLALVGTFYIQFEGGRYGGRGKYQVWRREFFGYDELHGSYPTEEDAVERVRWLKVNPSRKINP